MRSHDPPGKRQIDEQSRLRLPCDTNKTQTRGAPITSSSVSRKVSKDCFVPLDSQRVPYRSWPHPAMALRRRRLDGVSVHRRRADANGARRHDAIGDGAKALASGGCVGQRSCVLATCVPEQSSSLRDTHSRSAATRLSSGVVDYTDNEHTRYRYSWAGR